MSNSNEESCCQPSEVKILQWIEMCLLLDHIVVIHRESKKGATLTMAITLSVLDRFAEFFHCRKEHWISNKPCIRLPTTLSMFLHYLGKFKVRNFVLFRHVKHVSNVIFLLSIYLSNVMNISAKINTMQSINILLFVYSLSLTSLKLCS